MTTHLRHEALRFLIAGLINTAATYAIYLALLPRLDYTLAYTIAFVIGIVIAYVLSTSYVFRVERTRANMTIFPLIYLVQYLLGAAVLNIAVRWLSVPRQFALLASIAITIPVTFLLSRALLRWRRVHSKSAV
ncbi:MAG: GtrA family protein [Rudaea sp.]